MAKTQASYFRVVNEYPSDFSFHWPEHLFQIAHSLGSQSTDSFCTWGGDPRVSVCMTEVDAVFAADMRTREKFREVAICRLYKGKTCPLVTHGRRLPSLVSKDRWDGHEI